MTQPIRADLCIIGAGSGGLSVAAGAAMLGRKVVLIEKGEMGGDCLNTGCVPSKALIAAAAQAQAMREAGKFGLGAVEPQVDFSAVMDHVHGVIGAIAPLDSQERFEGLGVTVLREHADFTNETIFSNRTRPDHLIIIGGGPIGAEMAQAHRRLGANVTVIEGGKMLNREDPELADVVRQRLLNEGVVIVEDARAEKVAKSGADVSVSLGARTISGAHLLVAVGRKPTVDGMNLEAAGVEYSPKGIKTDARLRTSNKRIYAMGDVAGGRQFTHVAGYHASVLVRNILFKMPAKNNEHLSPRVTYCDPELAQVGLTEAEARERHDDVKIARWPFSQNDRAEAERDTEGFVKIVTDKKGAILGAGIVGSGAGDLLQPWTLAITSKLKIRAFTDIIAPYPTRGEASKRAAGDWYSGALFSARTRRLISLLSIFD